MAVDYSGGAVRVDDIVVNSSQRPRAGSRQMRPARRRDPGRSCSNNDEARAASPVTPRSDGSEARSIRPDVANHVLNP